MAKAEWTELDPGRDCTSHWMLTVENSSMSGFVQVHDTYCWWSVTAVLGGFSYDAGEAPSVAEAKRQCLEALKRYHAEIVDALSLMEKQEEPIA